MRILFLQKMAGISGSERYLLDILPALNKRNIHASFLVLQNKNSNEKNIDFINELKSKNVPIFILNSFFLFSPITLYKFLRIIKKNNFNILHTNLIHADLLGAFVKKFFYPKIKILSTKHGYTESFQSKFSFDHTKIKPDIFYFASKLAARYADSVVCISKSLENFYKNTNIVTAQKLSTIPYGFDFDNFPASEDNEKFNFGNPQLVVTGRLEPVKQHHLLLEILPMLKKKFSDISVVMVGDGSLLNSLKKQSIELGVNEFVYWVGFQSNVHSYISNSDLMIVPSRSEGFGLVILEAWHHAKPVIGFNVPALCDIVESGQDGILVEPFAKKELLNAIIEMLNDKQKLELYGKAGQIKQKELYGLNRMVHSTINALNNLTN
jgi:glycosyltransferase involved in cell wall biosynthesis